MSARDMSADARVDTSARAAMPLRTSVLAGVVRRAAASATVHTFGVNALVLGLGLISSVQLARGLGPLGRGELAAAFLWPPLLMYLASTGLIQSVLYFASRADAAPSKVLATAGLCGICQSLCAMAIGYALIPLLLAHQSPSIVSAARVFLWVIPVSMLSQYGLSVVQAQERFRAFNAIRLVIPAGYVIAVYWLDHVAALSAATVLNALLALNVLVLCGTLLALRSVFISRDFRFDRALAKLLMGYGAKVQAGGIPQTANLRLDQALLAAWFPPVQLGLYVAAVSAAGVGEILSTAVRTVASPAIARAGAAAGSRVLRRVFRRYIVASVCATVLLALILPRAISMLYGDRYAGAIAPALVLLAASLCFGAKQVLAGGAQALGDPWLASRSEIYGVVVTVAALLVLLKRFGIMGAAVATLLAYATQLVVVARGLSRAHRLHLRDLIGVQPRALTSVQG